MSHEHVNAHPLLGQVEHVTSGQQILDVNIIFTITIITSPSLNSNCSVGTDCKWSMFDSPPQASVSGSQLSPRGVVAVLF